MKQNITLALDKELLAQLKILAAKRSTSVSRMLADELTALVERSEQYEQSKRYALAAIDNGFHLGGKRVFRDELHER
jgi:predicted transcriptional regulator